MTRYVLDPARLGRQRRSREDPYSVVGRMLREHLGGDVLVEVRRRVRSDPRFRDLLDDLREASARADEALQDELRRRRAADYSPTSAAALPRNSEPSRT
jgi:hypothetical protein